MELDMEPNLLEVDIGEGSYNFANVPGAGFDDQKLLFRGGPNVVDGEKEGCDTLSSLHFSTSFDGLESCQDRCECPSCGQKTMYFCSKCRHALPCTQSVMPKVTLPLKIEIVKDCREKDTKSTAIHAKVLAHDHVKIHDYVPQKEFSLTFENDDKSTFLVFPEENAMTIEEAFNQLEDFESIRIIFIDATWQQARQLAKTPALAKLPRIRLEAKKTQYWRYQTGESDFNLATIEAIYHFMVEFYQHQNGGKPYDGRYDDLLYLFSFFYNKIHRMHGSITS